MHISVDIQWACHYKALCDVPNESFAVFHYWLLMKYRWRQSVCTTDFSANQLLPENINNLFLLCGGDFRSRARQWNRSCFTDVHFWIWIDANMGRKMNVFIFCSFKTDPHERWYFISNFFYKLWQVLKKMVLFFFSFVPCVRLVILFYSYFFVCWLDFLHQGNQGWK